MITYGPLHADIQHKRCEAVLQLICISAGVSSRRFRWRVISVGWCAFNQRRDASGDNRTLADAGLHAMRTHQGTVNSTPRQKNAHRSVRVQD